MRAGDSRVGTARKSLRPKSVTHVAGTKCHLCLRAGPGMNGGDDETRTRDLCRDRQRCKVTSCNFTAPIATSGALSNPQEVLLHPNCTQILVERHAKEYILHQLPCALLHTSGFPVLVTPCSSSQVEGLARLFPRPLACRRDRGQKGCLAVGNEPGSGSEVRWG